HRGIFLVAHSMGGLVARAIAVRPEFARKVKGVALLGTPNGGLLDDVRMAGYLLAVGEAIAGADPRQPHVMCQSARELLLEEPFIPELNAQWARAAYDIPMLTVAGGRRWLKF